VTTDIHTYCDTTADLRIAFYYVQWSLQYDSESGESMLQRLHRDIVALSQHSDLVFALEHEVHAPCLAQQKTLRSLSNVHWIMAGTALDRQDRIIPWQYHLWRIRDLYEEMPDLLLRLDPYRVKPWYFDAMLGTSKGPRPLIAQWIQEHGLQDRILYSLGPSPGQPLQQPMLHDTAFFVDKDWQAVDYCDYLHLNQHVRYRNRVIQMPCLMPLELYDRTSYSIVSETGFANDVHMITEKTAKVLIGRRLFVMFAGAGFLRYLRQQGFQTFDGIIDESYDNEQHDVRRWQLAFDQVRRLCEMDQDQVLQRAKPILEHNYSQVMARDLTLEPRHQIQALIEQYAHTKI